MYYLRLYKGSGEIKKTNSRFLGTKSILEARKNAYIELTRNHLISVMSASLEQSYEIRICDEWNKVLARIRYVELDKIGNTVICIAEDGHDTISKVKSNGQLIPHGSKGFATPIYYKRRPEFRFKVYRNKGGEFQVVLDMPRIYWSLDNLRRDAYEVLVDHNLHWDGGTGHIVGVFKNGAPVEMAVITYEKHGSEYAVLWDEGRAPKRILSKIKSDGTLIKI